jgi:F0F1-type ATP synthase assembly protein I
MLLKRILLAIISLVIGYAVTFLIVTRFLQTSVAEFWVGPEQPVNIPYFILTGIFIALGVGIWLDKFMGTDILPE